MSEVLGLTQAEIRALLDLIEFHDDWDECSERLGKDEKFDVNEYLNANYDY